jgi:phosphoglycolate phosphatase-like HAD superfamily hydrolase
LETAKPKPSPEALINYVKSLDVDICACIISGDSASDVHAGKTAGARTVAFLSGLFHSEELIEEKPDLILDNVIFPSKLH